MRILIVEDEEKLQSHLKELLVAEGFSAFTCSTPTELEGLFEVPGVRFDIVILDRLLYGFDCSILIPQLKSRMSKVRILVLSAINTPAEKASVLDLGADDYLSKPFEGSELVARIRALLRRNNAQLMLGDLRLDIESRSMTIGVHTFELTNKEYLLMKAMIEAPGKIFSKIDFYQKVWGMNSEVESNVVEVTINKLRNRLEQSGSSVQIRNSRRVGYWIEK